MQKRDTLHLDCAIAWSQLMHNSSVKRTDLFNRWVDTLAAIAAKGEPPK